MTGQNPINSAYAQYRDDPTDATLEVLLSICRTRITQRYHDQQDAEDIAQTAVLKLWRKLPTYDSQRGQFAPFVAVVARTTMLDMRKKKVDIPKPDDELVERLELRRTH